jgi:hypothetical protein
MAWTNIAARDVDQLAAIIKPAQARPVPARPYRGVPRPGQPHLEPQPRKELQMLAISTSVTDRLFYGQLKRNRQRERRPAAESAVVLGPLLVQQGARA